MQPVPPSPTSVLERVAKETGWGEGAEEGMGQVLGPTDPSGQ